MMPQEPEKAIKSPDSDAGLEYARAFAGSFEGGERLIDVCAGVFGRHRYADAACIGRNGGGTDGGGINIVGEEMFGETHGGLGAADDNRHDRRHGWGERKSEPSEPGE